MEGIFCTRPKLFHQLLSNRHAQILILSFYYLPVSIVYCLCLFVQSVSEMDKNYYDILGLKKNALPQQIADTYRKLVLRWHPKFAKEDQKTAFFYFSEISEAYEVLSDPIKRSFYDRYGWKKLKQGLFIDGELKGGYRFGNNPDEIFEKFFQNNNVMAKILDQKVIQKGSIFSHAFGALNYKDKYPNQDLIIKVACSLSQLYRGVAKKSLYERKILNLDGRTLILKNEEKLLQIKPGFGRQSVLVFKQQGHENIQRNKSNLIFKIEETPHPLYYRNGNDLVYLSTITLPQALSCQPIQIRTLDDRVLRISLDQIPNPQVLKQVVGQGMPIAGTRQKGNLYIKFNIQFPKNLGEDAKSQLRSLLSQAK